MPQAKPLPTFMEHAWKLIWVGSMMEHVAGGYFDAEDTADKSVDFVYENGKCYVPSFAPSTLYDQIFYLGY